MFASLCVFAEARQRAARIEQDVMVNFPLELTGRTARGFYAGKAASTYPPFYLPTYLPTDLPNYLPSYLP